MSDESNISGRMTVNPAMDLSVVSVHPFDHDQRPDHLAYWLSVPMEDRFAGMERLRLEAYGDDYETQYEFPGPAEGVRVIRR